MATHTTIDFLMVQVIPKVAQTYELVYEVVNICREFDYPLLVRFRGGGLKTTLLPTDRSQTPEG